MPLKTLYLLRHAKSSWKGPPLADFDRPLNNRGQINAPRMANYAFEQQIHPEIIVSSPALRTRHTAEYFHNRLLPQTELLLEPDLYECTASELWHIAKRFPDELSSVLLVGHNTCLEEIIRCFKADLVKFPTCGLATIQFSVARWQDLAPSLGTLTNLAFPKMLSP